MGLAAAILGGLVMNTSRAAVAIVPLVMLLMGIVTWRLLPAELVVQRQILLGAMVAAQVAAIGLSLFVMPKKWAALPEQFEPHSARRVLWGIISDYDKSAGFFGYGPNTNDILWPTPRRGGMSWTDCGPMWPMFPARG